MSQFYWLYCFVADDDYVSGAFDVAFGVGDTSVEVSINITDDSINEGSEAFGLVLKTTDDTPDLVEIVDPMRATGIIEDNYDTGSYIFVIICSVKRLTDFYCNGW